MRLDFFSAKTRQYTGFALMLLFLMLVTPWAYMHFHQEEVLWRKGQQAFAAGDYEQAAEYYSRALKKGKISYMLLDRLGDSSLATGRPDQAREAFQALRQRYPDDAQVLLKLARACWSTNDSGQALEVVDHALELKSDWKNALFLRAQILTSQGKFEEAINIYYRILGEE